jgi:hypothetical protein
MFDRARDPCFVCERKFYAPPVSGILPLREAGQVLEQSLGRWQVRYSRLREITIFNRGRVDTHTGKIAGFTVCLECGAWIRPRSVQEEEEERAGFRPSGTDHLYLCSFMDCSTSGLCMLNWRSLLLN